MRSDQSQIAQQGVALIGAAAIVLIALLPSHDHNILGLFGRGLALALKGSFGFGAWWWPPVLADLGWGRLRHRRWETVRAIKAFGFLVLLCLLAQWLGNAGGTLGAAIGGALVAALGIGAYLCAAAVLCWAVCVFFGAPHATVLVQRGRLRVAAAWAAGSAQECDHHARLVAARATHSNSLEAIVLEDEVEPCEQSMNAAAVQMPRAVPPPLPSRVEADATRPSFVEFGPEAPAVVVDARRALTFALPPIALLKLSRTERVPDEREIKSTRIQLEEQLAGYGVGGSIDGVTVGPVVATYEYRPEIGTKLIKIRSLGSELSMTLQRAVRVIAPLPNTARVGIEVPHSHDERATISLRELVDEPAWPQFSRGARLPLALGRSSRGEPIYSDLALMPHVLVAGATGAGKSVALNAMLMSLLLSRTPRELKLLMIDPKVVELGVYAGLPHLVAPVISEMDEGAAALSWAVREMERRYQLLAEASARDVDTFNALPDVVPLPRLVIVVDEFGDLISRSKHVEPLIVRLAQKSRAAGVHLVLATQRPSVDVVTGLIKANMPARVAFRTAQGHDSKTIIDQYGAERLLGRGDALCLLPGQLDLQRVHGALVTHEEVVAVCQYLRAQGDANYDESVLATARETLDDGEGLYQRAVGIIMREGNCSASKLQRELTIGYNKAAKLVERLETEGLVGPAKKGGGVRDVLRAAESGGL